MQLPWMIIGFIVAVAVCYVAFSVVKSKKVRTYTTLGPLPSKTKSTTSVSLKKSSEQVAPEPKFAPTQTLPPSQPGADFEVVTKLYGRLLNMALGDEQKVRRLIDNEQRLNPGGNRQAWISEAISKWHDDLRGR